MALSMKNDKDLSNSDDESFYSIITNGMDETVGNGLYGKEDEKEFKQGREINYNNNTQIKNEKETKTTNY